MCLALSALWGQSGPGRTQLSTRQIKSLELNMRDHFMLLGQVKLIILNPSCLTAKKKNKKQKTKKLVNFLFVHF